MRHPTVVDALYEASGLDNPASIARLVLDAVGPDWRRVTRDELTAALASSVAYAEAGGADWPGWQWDWADVHDLWLAARDNLEGLSVLWVTHAIFITLAVREKHLRSAGYDPHAEARAMALDLMARLLVAIRPQPWERAALNHVANGTTELPAGVVIRHRREALNMTEVALARAVGVDRSTVVRWESGERRPHRLHRRALARVLGGQAADYDE